MALIEFARNVAGMEWAKQQPNLILQHLTVVV